MGGFAGLRSLYHFGSTAGRTRAPNSVRLHRLGRAHRAGPRSIRLLQVRRVFRLSGEFSQVPCLEARVPVYLFEEGGDGALATSWRFVRSGAVGVGDGAGEGGLEEVAHGFGLALALGGEGDVEGTLNLFCSFKSVCPCLTM